jgi:hypothetical protein
MPRPCPRITSLLATITLGYPIGVVMMLETGSPDVNFAPKPLAGAGETAAHEPKQLLPDGQQRLTSLYQSLKAQLWPHRQGRLLDRRAAVRRRCLPLWIAFDMPKVFVWNARYIADDPSKVQCWNDFFQRVVAATKAVLGHAADAHAADRKLRRWYWSGVLGELYGGESGVTPPPPPSSPRRYQGFRAGPAATRGSRAT